MKTQTRAGSMSSGRNEGGLGFYSGQTVKDGPGQ